MHGEKKIIMDNCTKCRQWKKKFSISFISFSNKEKRHCWKTPGGKHSFLMCLPGIQSKWREDCTVNDRIFIPAFFLPLITKQVEEHFIQPLRISLGSFTPLKESLKQILFHHIVWELGAQKCRRTLYCILYYKGWKTNLSSGSWPRANWAVSPWWEEKALHSMPTYCRSSGSKD